MANLLPSGELRTSVEQGFEDIFDTFARSITFTLYKTPTETILSLDDNFNNDWIQNNPRLDGTTTYTEAKQDFSARIWFLDYEQQLKIFSFEGEQIEGARVARTVSKVKIQIKDDAKEFIQTATRAIFLNQNWKIISDPKSVGIFDFKYHTYILQKQA